MMPKLKAAGDKIAERCYSSLLVRLGIPTLLAGLTVLGPVLVMGYSLGLLTNPGVWRGWGLAMELVRLGAVSLVWGWFFDPILERTNQSTDNREH